MSTKERLCFYPPNFNVSRIATKRVFMDFNVSMGPPFISKVLYNLWVRHMKFGKGKASSNLTYVNPSGINHLHFKNVHLWVSRFNRLYNLNDAYFKVSYL